MVDEGDVSLISFLRKALILRTIKKNQDLFWESFELVLCATKVPNYAKFLFKKSHL
jgi:hypothetical protein